jgi:mitochondrial import inner membrane translocase subunit TIM50
MLSRALLPLLRSRTLQAVAHQPAIIAAHHPRWYAKSNNQKVPYQLPDSLKASQSGRFGKNSSGATSGQLSESQSPDASPAPEQTEFDSTARDNTASPFDSQPPSPLPDLTKGIPSTLAAELDPSSSKRRGPTGLNLTEDPSRAESDDGGAGDDIPRDAYVSSLDRRRARFMNIVALLFLLSGVVGTTYLGRNWETAEEAKAHADAPSGWGLGLFYNRIKARLGDITRYYKDPAFEKLLPDDDPQLRQPYTLVLSLEDLLVHSEWTREHGWRVAKRPGVDYFLRYLQQYYELVLFTSVPSMMAEQVLKKLDPYRIIRWPLFREATKYKDGEYVKVRFPTETLGI